MATKILRRDGLESRIERLSSDVDRRAGNRFEVFAPDGFRFVDAAHSRICRDDAAALSEANAQIETCPADCDCRDE